MAERTSTPTGTDVDPRETPFELPPIEGLPFEEGSQEEAAIRSVLEEARRERADRSPEDIRGRSAGQQ